MATLRRRIVCRFGSAVVAAASVFMTVMLTVGLAVRTAAAQTPYPPSPTTVALCTESSTYAGTVAVGQTITFTMCGPFQPGAVDAISVNDQPAGTGTADGTGAVTITVTAVKCGNNSAAATGPNAAGAGALGATATSGETFLVTCEATHTSGRLAFTGADIFRSAAAALALIVIGAGLVVTHRRRRSPRG